MAMGYRSQKRRPEPRTSGPKGWRYAARVSGVLVALMTASAPLGAAGPKSSETRGNGKAAEKMSTPASAAPAGEKAAREQGRDTDVQRIRKNGEMPRARRRGGSSPLEGRVVHGARGKAGRDGEVEGGTGAGRSAPRDPKLEAQHTSTAVKPPCVRHAVQFERGFGGDAEAVPLTRCDGRPTSVAIEQLSILVRPMNVARPSALASRIRRAAHREWLPGVKRIHEGLVTRLQSVVDRFQARKITLVSGYRPTSLGSFHQSARALDLHVEGVANEKLVQFCRTLPDTGCGYYPNSSFVHIDVRPAGTGHVYWIDASGPGEPARYVASWPPKDFSAANGIARPDPAAPRDEQTHSGTPRPPLGGNDSKIDARTTAPWWGGESRDSAFSP